MIRALWRRLGQGLTSAASATGSVPPTRLLLLADTVGATQLINFVRPFANEVAAGRASLTVLAEADLGPGGSRSAEESAARLWRRLDPTALVLSRYSSGRHGAFVARARDAGRPVVYHLDDDLFAVPEAIGLAKHRHYNEPARLAGLRAAVEASDLVYASTPHLAERLRQHGISRPIVAGDIPCAIDPERLARPRPRPRPVIGYMATASHGRDLELALPALEGLLGQRKELSFELFGSLALPPRLAAFGSRVVHHPPIADYDAFLARLAELGWWVGLAPLEDTLFNRSKTETKWLEYTFAGVPTVASDMEVYRRCCAGGAGLLVRDGAWGEALPRLLDDPDARGSLIEAARRRSRDYSLARMRAQLERVIASAATVAGEVAAPASA